MPGRRYRPRVRILLAGLAASGLAGCSGANHHADQAGPPVTSASTAPTPTAPTTAASTRTAPAPTGATPPAPPAFAYTIGTVTASDLPFTWRPGCPLPPSALRLLQVTYWGFDGRAHPGRIVVNQAVSGAVVQVFRTLYEHRFPIHQMVPQDAFHGDDNAAAAADDTSGFNCRAAVAPGPPQWSAHAFGEAIDVNDVENPYVYGATVIPPAGRAYLDRADVRTGMAEPGGILVEAFASVGWQWGGRWSPGTDYQHFSSTGG